MPPKVVIGAIFLLIVILGAALRFQGLGQRSLWGDEFCTWKVAEMPVAESLRWQPELTKPPLYQFVVRAVKEAIAEPGSGVGQQQSPKKVPSEWHLRLPAALCGALAVAVMWWLGWLAGGWAIAAAGAVLFAVQALQIDYSQEARPYSMLVLGSMLSTGMWYRLVTRLRGNKATRQQGEDATGGLHKQRILWLAIAYMLGTVLAFHANYLMALTVAAQVLWAAAILAIDNRKSKIDNLKIAAVVLFATAALCVPIVWHFLRHRTSVFQGLDWIAAPTIQSSINVLSEITFGPVWVFVLLAPALIAWVWTVKTPKGRSAKTPKVSHDTAAHAIPGVVNTSPYHHIATSPHLGGFFSLLFVWLLAAWGGLLLISWIAHPAMVARYALPAAAPAILIPLIVLHRFDRRLPLLVAGLFVVGTAPAWTGRIDRVKPGFREMVAFLDEYADPQREAVVAVIERTTSPGWEEMDLLGFEYYGRHEGTEARRHEGKGKEATRPKDERSGTTRQHGNGENDTSRHRHIATSPHLPVEVLYLRHGLPDGDQPILRDPRALWLVTFLADPVEALESAGRRVEQIEIEDKVFEQLYFEPYRLIRVAAMRQ